MLPLNNQKSNSSKWQRYSVQAVPLRLSFSRSDGPLWARQRRPPAIYCLTFHLAWLAKTFSFVWVFAILPLLGEQWKGNGGKTRRTRTYTHLARSTQRKSNQWWYIGKCQTRINGLITLLSILPVLSVFFVFFFPSALRLSSLFFTALIGSVKGAGAVKNQSHRQKTLGRI